MESNKVYHKGDILSIMAKSFQKETIDFALLDLPYFESAGNISDKENKNIEYYSIWLYNVLFESNRILKSGTYIYIIISSSIPNIEKIISKHFMISVVDELEYNEQNIETKKLFLKDRSGSVLYVGQDQKKYFHYRNPIVYYMLLNRMEIVLKKKVTIKLFIAKRNEFTK